MQQVIYDQVALAWIGDISSGQTLRSGPIFLLPTYLGHHDSRVTEQHTHSTPTANLRSLSLGIVWSIHPSQIKCCGKTYCLCWIYFSFSQSEGFLIIDWEVVGDETLM